MKATSLLTVYTILIIKIICFSHISWFYCPETGSISFNPIQKEEIKCCCVSPESEHNSIEQKETKFQCCWEIQFESETFIGTRKAQTDLNFTAINLQTLFNSAISKDVFINPINNQTPIPISTQRRLAYLSIRIC
jgi:hypothetical protein